MPKELSPKHQRFVEEFLTDFNAAGAARRAGYAKGRANVTAFHLLRRPDIASAVAAARAKMAERANVTADRVITEMAAIAFSDITKAVRWGSALVVKDENGEHILQQAVEMIASDDLPREITAAISEIAKTRDGIRIKFHDKQAALLALGKHLGMFIERHEHGKPGDFSKMDDAELMEQAGETAKALGLPADTVQRIKAGLAIEGNETEH